MWYLMEKIESISESHLKRLKINEEFYNVNGQKDIITVSVLPKLIYKFNAIPLKVDLKIPLEAKIAINSQNNFEERIPFQEGL